MRNIAFLLSAVAALGIASASGASAADCSAATLKGHYTYWLQGADENGKIYAEVGSEQYDGAGKMTTSVTSSATGKAEKDSGTYTVNADCSGVATYASGGVYNFYAAPTGDSFVFINTKAGTVGAGENTRVSN